jgi:predicted transcriptional regulator
MDNAVALLSIKPEFANKILDGSKVCEFRKTKFSRKITHAVVYSTAPEKKVTGFFKVSHVWSAYPNLVWNECRDFGAGISRERFFEYYKGCSVAVVIEVHKVYRLRQPIALTELNGELKAPQSFRYLDESVIDKLRPLCA